MGKDSKKLASVDTSIVLHTNMRKLCENHSNGMRNILFCLIDDLPGKAEAMQNLLENRLEIGNSIKPYYGDLIGNIFSEYLRLHIMLSIEAIKAIKKQDHEIIEAIDKRWKDNADELAIFMSKANPKWNLEDLKIMLGQYVELSQEQILHRFARNYEGDVIAYEKLHSALLHISDFVSSGIALQFPKRFKTDYARKSKFVFDNFF